MASFVLLPWGTSSAHLIGNQFMIRPGQGWPRLNVG